MTMKLRIDGSSTIEIKDDNTTIVSSDMKKIIEDKFEQPDNKQDSKPDITIKD